MVAPAEVTFAPLLLAGIGLMLLVAGGFVWFVVSYQQRLYRQQLAQRAAEASHQQALLAAVIEAQEAERARIGRDLHDDVASSVAMAQMLVERLAVPHPADDPAALFTVAREVLAAAVADVRSTSHQLYPASLARVGLVKALERLADLSRHAESLAVQFEAHYPHALPEATELALYRICQELVHNSLKHAHGATSLRIRLHQAAPNWCWRWKMMAAATNLGPRPRCGPGWGCAALARGCSCSGPGWCRMRHRAGGR